MLCYLSKENSLIPKRQLDVGEMQYDRISTVVVDLRIIVLAILGNVVVILISKQVDGVMSRRFDQNSVLISVQ